MKKKLALPVDMIKVDNCFKLQQELRGDASKSKEWAFDLPFKDCLKSMSILTAQSSGGRIDNKLSYDIGLLPTNDKDRGDRMSISGNYYELKGSFFTTSNKILNLVQIRPWHNVNYICYAIDVRDIEIEFQLFYLSKDQMDLELTQSTSAHGTKKSNINNINNERAIRIGVDEVRYQHWVTEYGVSLDELRNQINSDSRLIIDEQMGSHHPTVD